MKLLRQGKVKDIYELENGNILLYFSDRISAFDIQMTTPIPRKGEILCKFGEYWFNKLGAKHHMIRVQDSDKMVVKRLDMIPIEFVIRGYLYGSLLCRYNKGQTNILLPNTFRPIMAAKLTEPLFDPTTKSEEHDIPINAEEMVLDGILLKKELDFIKQSSIRLYKKMSRIAEKAGFIIADVKFEFGRDAKTGEILLGDSLGPDEYRLWLRSDYQPGKTQESYDKQLLRDWLIKIGFKDSIDKLAKEGKKPEPPVITPHIVAKISDRYLLAYEKITGKKL
jgi:phosphoribosylaminoimidazole-succinocarboxamide synthase